MARLSPNCDRHPNLQMLPCLLRQPTGLVAGHVCPVPGCGRHVVQNNYLGTTNVEVVLDPGNAGQLDASLKSSNRQAGAKPIDSVSRPLNRNAAARAAILKAIEESRRS